MFISFTRYAETTRAKSAVLDLVRTLTILEKSANGTRGPNMTVGLVADKLGL